jgi:hypothetical protein
MSLSKIIAAAIVGAIPHITVRAVPVRDRESNAVLFDLGEVRIANLRQLEDGTFRFDVLGDTERFGRWNGTHKMAAVFCQGQVGPVSYIPLSRLQELAELQESQPTYAAGRHEGPVTVVKAHLRRISKPTAPATNEPQYATEMPEPTGA